MFWFRPIFHLPTSPLPILKTKIHFSCLIYILSQLLYLQALAQFDYRPVSITLTNGNAIKGELKFSDQTITQKSVFFRATKNSLEQPVAAQDISRLVLNSSAVYEGQKFYLVYYNTVSASFPNDLISRIDSAFFLAEVLLESSSIKLYRLFNEAKTERFILSRDKMNYPLENIYITLNNSGKFYKNPAYKQTLKKILYECSTIDTENTPYEAKSLTDIVAYYLKNCQGDAQVVVNSQPSPKTIVQIGVGLTRTINSHSKAVDASYFQAPLLNVKFLFPKNFRNVYLLLNAGPVLDGYDDTFFHSKFHFGAYIGRYVGKSSLQFHCHTGLGGTWLGLTHNKSLSVELGYTILSSILDKFEDPILKKPLMFGVRYSFPPKKP